MYITGISAFSAVYMKFIRSTLVRTQKLKIRIYTDRRNNYFYSNEYMKEISTAFEEMLYLQECIR